MAKGDWSNELDYILAVAIIPVCYLFFEVGGVGVGAVLSIVFLGGLLYREFHKKDTDVESEGDIHQFFSQKTHDLWNSFDMKGKILFILGQILAFIIAVLFSIYILLTPAFWFFCSMAEGQSCGVEIVFWPIGFF
jgi:hypothetical protein